MIDTSLLPFPTWKPDTCHCIARLDTFELIQRCRTHNTYREMQIHNNSFSTKGSSPTETKERAERLIRLANKDKPEFQIR